MRGLFLRVNASRNLHMPMTVTEALQSLNMNRFAVKGEGRGRPGPRNKGR